jgi:hypothetical protein
MTTPVLQGKEGMLKKKGKKTKSVVSRFYRLGTFGKEAGMLLYWQDHEDFASEKSISTSKGCIMLSGALVSSYAFKDRPARSMFCIEIRETIAHGDRSRINRLYASTAEERDEWVSALSAASHIWETFGQNSPLEQSFGGGELLAKNDKELLWSWIPSRHRLRTARLAYSGVRHGYNLNLLYKHVGKAGEAAGVEGGWSKDTREAPCILIIKTDQEELFGCFTSEPWRNSAQYYGSGECFVFRLGQKFEKFSWAPGSGAKMMMMGSKSFLCIGSDPAIYLNDDLSSGYTAASKTFKSRPLIDGQRGQNDEGGRGDDVVKFKCVAVEAYVFCDNASHALAG